MQLVVISGLSGSGKSVALNVLEDARFYCVDNLPATLLGETIDFLRQAGYQRVAVTVDARSGAALAELPRSLRALKALGIDVRLLFLDAGTDTLIKRFSETRRPHPLAGSDATVDEAIRRERALLEEIVELGQRLDTSELAPNALRAWIQDLVAAEAGGLTLAFESFGYKQGIPLDADLVFDVRTLPNPFYDPKLRPLSGLDEPVARFLEALPAARALLADIGDFVERWLPAFVRDNRSYLTVALGCTGGQHRSVWFVERLAARFRPATRVLVRHRQLPGPG